MRYSYIIQHRPGCDLYTADALSCMPLSVTADESFEKETTTYVNSIIGGLPVSDMRLDQI